MKPVYTEEVARELGYQKFWPEWQDWAFGFMIACGILLIGAGVIALAVHFIH